VASGVAGADVATAGVDSATISVAGAPAAVVTSGSGAFEIFFFAGARLTGGFSEFGAATDFADAAFVVGVLGVVDRGVVVRGAVVRGVVVRDVDVRGVAGFAGVAFAGVALVGVLGAAGFAGVAGLAFAAAAAVLERGCLGVAGLRGAAGSRGARAGLFGVLLTRAAGVRAGGVGCASGRSGSESTRQPYQPPNTPRGSITNRQLRVGRSGPRMRVARKLTQAQCRVQKFTYR